MIVLKKNNNALLFICVWLIFWISQPASSQPLYWEYPASNPYISHIFKRIEDEQLLLRLNNAVQDNFALNKAVVFKLYDGDSALFNVSENTSYLPNSFLIELKEGLGAKYPSQPEIRNKIFDAALMQLIWVEFGRVLISQFSIPLTGNEEVLLDEFSTIMMLNSDVVEQDYILDAAEYYLLIDRSRSLFEKGEKQEGKLDKQRYKHIVCMVLGRDYEPFKEKIEEITWDEDSLKGCKDSLGAIYSAWQARLKPALKEESLLHLLN